MRNFISFLLFLSLVSCVSSTTARGIVDRHPTGYMFSDKPNQLRDFTSDGCSNPSPYIKYPYQDSYELCCVAHDIQYWKGGPGEERQKADEELRTCIEQQGHSHTAYLVYLGVRVGGNERLPTTWRWGYGWTRDRGTGAFNEEESRQITLQSQKIPIDLREVPIVKPTKPLEFIELPKSRTGDHCKDIALNYLEGKLHLRPDETRIGDSFNPLLEHVPTGPGRRTLSMYVEECGNNSIQFQFNLPRKSACMLGENSVLQKLFIHLDDIRMPKGCVPSPD